MRFVNFTLMVAILSPSSMLVAQPRQDDPCDLIFFDREAVVASCTQLIESGKLKAEALARAYMTTILARETKAATVDHQQIIAETTAAIESNPRERLAYGFRLDSYLQTGELNRALEDANKYVELDPNDWNALNVRSTVYVAKGDYERALADDTQAVEIAPKQPTAYANRAST